MVIDKVTSISFQRALSIGCRCYSAGRIQVPLKIYSLEGRYASALFSASAKTSSLEFIEKELSKLKKLIQNSSSFRNLIKNPAMTVAEKKAVLEALQTETKESAIFGNFLKLLSENGRMALIPKIIAAFEEIMQAHRKEVTLTVTSAKELDGSLIKKLTDLVSKKFIEPDQTLKVAQKIDASILGGLIVEIGERSVDLSVLSRINKINRTINEPI